MPLQIKIINLINVMQSVDAVPLVPLIPPHVSTLLGSAHVRKVLRAETVVDASLGTTT